MLALIPCLGPVLVTVVAPLLFPVAMASGNFGIGLAFLPVTAAVNPFPLLLPIILAFLF